MTLPIPRRLALSIAVAVATLLAGCDAFPTRIALFDVGGGEPGDGSPIDGPRPDMEPPDVDAGPDTGLDMTPADEGPPMVETCDGRDEDGDGTIDEGTSPMMPCQEGEGRCAIAGMRICRDGAIICAGAPVDPIDELCNDEDDDCDGQPDEDFDIGRACTLGMGVCAIDSIMTCRPDGTLGCTGTPSMEGRSDEICDGFDNDCDGATDEGEIPGTRLTEPCRADEAEGECRNGSRQCSPQSVGGVALWEPCLPSVAAMTDLCDGRDEDCDGTIDNGFDIGQPCGVPLLEGGFCGLRGTFQCTEDGSDSECRPRPEADCNGLDDNCDGVIDDGLACAGLITRECRAWLGWTTRELDNPGDTWGTCPAMPELAADLSCNGSGPGADFGQLELFGDLDAADDRLGVRFGCRANAGLIVGYIAAHCALYLGVAAAASAPPDGAETWSSCPAEPVGGDPDTACTSGDARFRPMPLPIDLDEGAVLGAAFRCTDELQPRRAEAMAGAVEIVIAWADATLGEPAPDWEAICAPGGDGDARTGCVATGGDGRFHTMPFTADVDAGDKFAIGIRPRPAP